MSDLDGNSSKPTMLFRWVCFCIDKFGPKFASKEPFINTVYFGLYLKHTSGITFSILEPRLSKSPRLEFDFDIEPTSNFRVFLSTREAHDTVLNLFDSLFWWIRVATKFSKIEKQYFFRGNIEPKAFVLYEKITSYAVSGRL